MTGAAVLGLLALAFLFALCGWLLGYSGKRLRRRDDPLADRIGALLPQTQCGQCGFPGCRPYAEALARGDAEINLCPPGGEAGVKALADLLGRDPLPLRNGPPAPMAKSVARIDEDRCIGCTLCIQACPVDAIVGAAKLMHTVIAAECTGCALCLPPCPVDCIDLVPVAAGVAGWRWPAPQGN